MTAPIAVTNVGSIGIVVFATPPVCPHRLHDQDTMRSGGVAILTSGIGRSEDTRRVELQRQRIADCEVERRAGQRRTSEVVARTRRRTRHEQHARLDRVDRAAGGRPDGIRCVELDLPG